MTDTCFYCERNNDLKELMTELCVLDSSTVYLFNDQNFKGRCVVANNHHVTELFYLPREEMIAYMDEVTLVAQAVFNVVKPNKINYAVFGDIVSHLHYHIVPKSKNGLLWGEFFCSQKTPEKYLSGEDFKNLSDSIKQEIYRLSGRK